jgi:N-acetylneuraminic acid mutarotase
MKKASHLFPVPFAVIFAALTFSFFFTQPAAGDVFVPTGSMAASCEAFTLTLLPDGEVLVVGGIDLDQIVLNSAEIYNPATGNWRSADTLNTARFGHTATLLSNGEVLVVGGVGGPYNASSLDYLCSAEIYNPANNQWTTISSSLLNSAEFYNPSNKTWTVTTSPMNVPRYAHTATLLPNGEVLVAGGFDSSGNPVNTAELYNPATEMWTPTGSLNTPRAAHTATLLPNGLVLVVGGEDSSDVLADAELFNPMTGKWTVTSSPATACEFHTATLLPDGQVLIVGGEDNGGNSLNNSQSDYWDLMGGF